MLKIVDYGIGNLGSIRNMLKKEGVVVEFATTASDIASASKIIIPGNGAFDACMKQLKNSSMFDAIQAKVLHERIPCLGICVGAQMLGFSSEEGQDKGLGWLNMTVKKLPKVEKLALPHMGWNYVQYNSMASTPFSELDKSRFYFIHNYYMQPEHKENILFLTNYGIDFVSGVIDNNIIGVQFHPEKSHNFGRKLFKIFASM